MNKNSFGEKTPNKKFSQYTFPGTGKFQKVVNEMSLTEKVIYLILLITTSIGALLILWNVNTHLLIEIPAYEGVLKEGIVGTPGPINPLLSTSGADRALTNLVYSGLMKFTPEGKITNELSSEHSVSEDGTVYFFKLRKDAVFHDGIPVTAEDVVFTIEKVKDPWVRSTLAPDWRDIVVEAQDESTVKFTLAKPQKNFLELSTLGILPKHIWKDVDGNRFAFNSANVKPIGAGPYKFYSVNLKEGSPIKYTLQSFDRYIKGKPYITNITFSFFSEEREAWLALQKGEINALAGFSPQRINSLNRSGITIKTNPLPRVFALFLNRNKNEALTSIEVRKALSMAINREEFLSEILNGQGEILEGPLPFPKIKMLKVEKETEEETDSDEEQEEKIKSPKDLLSEAGWEYSSDLRGFTTDDETVLTIEISTVSNSDLQRVAEIVKRQWEQLGIKTNIALYGSNELNQNVLRPREFEALLFGYILDNDFDLFPFWHSSERNDPGMNLSGYTNISVDNLLEEYRKEEDLDEKVLLNQEIYEAIASDVPAIFLYSPYFLYVVPDNIKNFSTGHMIFPEDRFLNVHEWFLETEKIWSFFLKDDKKHKNNY